jgi:hypothetical protein
MVRRNGRRTTTSIVSLRSRARMSPSIGAEISSCRRIVGMEAACATVAADFIVVISGSGHHLAAAAIFRRTGRFRGYPAVIGITPRLLRESRKCGHRACKRKRCGGCCQSRSHLNLRLWAGLPPRGGSTRRKFRASSPGKTPAGCLVPLSLLQVSSASRSRPCARRSKRLARLEKPVTPCGTDLTAPQGAVQSD